MAEMKIEFLSAGFKEILMSDGVRSILAQKGDEICARANANLTESDSDGYKVTTMPGNYGGGRWVTYVQATDFLAALDEAENKSLTKAVK